MTRKLSLIKDAGEGQTDRLHQVCRLPGFFDENQATDARLPAFIGLGKRTLLWKMAVAGTCRLLVACSVPLASLIKRTQQKAALFAFAFT